MLDQLKIAIVCDWLLAYAGAERVIHQMHELFPKAPIYTSLFNPRSCHPFSQADVRESSLRFLPGARRFHRLAFPFMPRAFEAMDLSEYDLVLSSSHSAAKGVITRPETLHVSYCHSPMRYVWDHSHSYQKTYKRFYLFKALYGPFLHKVRLWDRLAAERVDRFLANSHYIQKRIDKYYGRDSEVVMPPVDLSSFTPAPSGKTYLAVGRLIPYKRFDLIVNTFNTLGKPLKIVGDGPEYSKLKRAAGSNISFLGRVSEEELIQNYQEAKALIFPQLEDFGIVPLEAMACGTPVVAYGAGGALETVKDGVSGLFFDEQTVGSMAEALERFEQREWSMDEVAKSVAHFSPARFKAELRHFLERAWKAHCEMLA